MPDLSPTARALQTLELIQASPGVTADRLADKLGVTDRAARRYVGLLRDAGIPISSTRGRYGGYRLGRGLRLPPLTFSATEALGLVMAVLQGHHAAGDPSDPVGSALGKIIRALPEPIAAQAETVRQNAAAAPDHSAVRPDPDITTRLVRASADQHRVRVDYRSESGSAWQAEIDPWAVIVRHGRWYVLGWSYAADDRRVFRIDRVGAVVQLDPTFDTPEIDPVALLEEHLSVGWEYACEVLADAPVELVRSCLPGGLGRLEASGDEASPRTRITGTTGNPWWYAERLTQLPCAFSVVGGPELRHATATIGARMVAATGAGPDEPCPGRRDESP